MDKATREGEVKSNQFIEALNSVAEASATLIPLIALILGIGMMRLLPGKVSTPLFFSEKDASSFYARTGIEPLGRSPVMLVSESCDACQALQQELYQSGIGFEEVDVNSSSAGKALYAQARYATSAQTLPLIIVGSNVVRPDVAAVRQVLGQKR